MTVSGGLKAIKIFKKLILQKLPCFRVVLLDYSMPDINGPETAEEIFSICDAAGIERPVIFCVSAYQEESFIKSALGAGMKDFFTKPVTCEQIARVKAIL